MGYVGVVFALFTLGYIVGVWTALLVVKQPQRAYEEAGAAFNSDRPVIVLHPAAMTVARSSPDASGGARGL
jgi:hypothetical protein